MVAVDAARANAHNPSEDRGALKDCVRSEAPLPSGAVEPLQRANPSSGAGSARLRRCSSWDSQIRTRDLMKLHSLAASLTLAGLTVLGLGSPASAGDVLPFQGVMAGTADVSEFPVVVLRATGNATHLGDFSVTMPHFVTPPTAVGTFEFVAANGDKIFGTMTGDSVPAEMPNFLRIVETANITGGTGRFDGAGGGFTLTRLYNRVTLSTSGTFSG